MFFESGIPSTGSLGKFEPRIYFGENSPQYSIVGALPRNPSGKVLKTQLRTEHSAGSLVASPAV